MDFKFIGTKINFHYLFCEPLRILMCVPLCSQKMASSCMIYFLVSCIILGLEHGFVFIGNVLIVRTCFLNSDNRMSK